MEDLKKQSKGIEESVIEEARILENVRADQDAEKYATLCDRWGFEPIDNSLYEMGCAGLRLRREKVRGYANSQRAIQDRFKTQRRKPDYMSFYTKARSLSDDFGRDLTQKRNLIEEIFPGAYKRNKHLNGERFGAFFNNIKKYAERKSKMNSKQLKN